MNSTENAPRINPSTTLIEQAMARQPIPADEERMIAEATIIGGEAGQRLDDDLVEKDARRNSGRDPRGHFATNHSSEAGHPCKRHLVYARLDCEKRKPLDVDALYRVGEGNETEWKMVKALGDVGFKVDAGQTLFTIPWLELRGRIDGMLPLNRAIEIPGWPSLPAVPCDVKSVNPMFWDETETIEDIKRNRHWWIRANVDQLNLYLFSEGKEFPFGYFIERTFGKRPRFVPMARDYELFRADAHKLLSVNEHVRTGTYPEPIPWDREICSMCDWQEMCPVSRTTRLQTVEKDDLPALRNFLDLQEWHLRYEAAHRSMIGDAKKPGRFRGFNAVIEDIEITTTEGQRTAYEIPDELKPKYAVKRPFVTTKIQRIGGLPGRG